MRHGLDQGLVHAQGTKGLAVLGEDELAPRRPAGAALGQFAEGRIEESIGALVEAEPLDGVLQDIGHQGEDRPPITGRSGGRSGLGDRVPSLEEVVVHDGDDGRIRLVLPHLAQARHLRL